MDWPICCSTNRLPGDRLLVAYPLLLTTDPLPFIEGRKPYF